MTLGLLQIGLLAWVGFAVALTLVCTATMPLLRRALARVRPATRASLLRLLLVAPVLGGLGAALLCFAPKALHPLLPHLDHCTTHGDGHLHFCFEHPPQLVVGEGFWLLVAGGVVVIAALTTRRVLRARGLMYALRSLRTHARFDPAKRAWVFPHLRPLAVAAGLWRPRTFVSTGLVEALDPDQLEVVLAHERAHVQRRDGLWNEATELFAFGQLPSVRRALRADLEVACEQACDESAALRIGDRLRVAAALLAVERLRHDAAPVPGASGFDALPGPAFARGDLGARVAFLLDDPVESRWQRWLLPAMALALGLSMIAVSDPLHHWTETMMHRLLG